MLFQEHGGHDDQRGQGKGCCFYKFFISQCFAVCKRHMYCKRVEHMNAGQDIRRSICTVQPFYYICEDIISWKFGRTYVLSIWINIGNNQENSHSHHKIKCQLIVFMFVFVKKYKINHSQDHVWKPQHIRNDKELTKWNPVIKYCMYDMIAVNRSVLQVTEEQDINDAVNSNHKSMPVFGNKTFQNFTFFGELFHTISYHLHTAFTNKFSHKVYKNFIKKFSIKFSVLQSFNIKQNKDFTAFYYTDIN